MPSPWPDIELRSDGNYAITFPAPGPFIVLTFAQLDSLVATLHGNEWLWTSGAIRLRRPAP